VENRASQKGYNLFVATSANDPDKKYLDMGIHGLIIGLTTTCFHASDTIYEIHHKKYPYTIVSYVTGTNNNYISTDHRHGAFLTTEHLIKTGYKYDRPKGDRFSNHIKTRSSCKRFIPHKG
jgi:DNA-binding LacI/PurR family transcriptional regulator